jgi:hypothetical protein
LPDPQLSSDLLPHPKAHLLDEEEVHRPRRRHPHPNLVNRHQSRTVNLSIHLVPVPVVATAMVRVAQVAATAVQHTITALQKPQALP